MSGAETEIVLQENWIRTVVANKVCTTTALLDLLHTECGLSKNKGQIHALLTNFKQREKKNLKYIKKTSMGDFLPYLLTAMHTTLPKTRRYGEF